MANEQVLVVEDEEDIQELLYYNLTKDGFRIKGALSGEEALSKTETFEPDIVLLDIMLPGINGLEVCRELRMNEKTRSTPIIMLTARGEEADVITGLEIGADDYIVKPFSPRVLTSRMRAVLRRRNKRAQKSQEDIISVGDITIDPGRFKASVGGMLLELTNMEFRVLHFLAQRPGWVYTRSQIVEAARGENYPVTDRSVDVLIVGLRRKLGACSSYIETVRGVGYRFRDM